MSDTRSNTTDLSDDWGEPLGMLVLGDVVLAIVGLFYWTWIAIVGLIYGGLCLGLIIWLKLFENDSALIRAGAVLILISAAATPLFVALVGGPQTVSFGLAGTILLSLFTLGVLLSIVSRALSFKAITVQTIAVATLTLGLAALPPPPGCPEYDHHGHLHEHHSGETLIIVTVVSQDNLPVRGAEVNLYSKEEDNSDYHNRQSSSTNPEGEAVLVIRWDPSDKTIALIVSSRSDTRISGSLRPVHFRRKAIKLDALEKGEIREVDVTVQLSE